MLLALSVAVVGTLVVVLVRLDGTKGEVAEQSAVPTMQTSLGQLSPSLLLAGGSLQSPAAVGVVASRLPGGLQLGGVVEGGPSQGDALAVAPDGRHAYLLDRTWLADEQRAEWQLNELELPSLRVIRRTRFADGIDLLGRARIVAAGHDGREVYVETWHASGGPTRFDPQLGVGQSEGTYAIAVYDVAQGAFSRTIGLDAPWCGVGELHALADGRLAVLCTLGHQPRLQLVDPRLGQVVGNLRVSGEQAAVSADSRRMWVVSGTGQVQEIDLAQMAIARSVEEGGGNDACNGCVPHQRLHASADGSTLFIRAAARQLVHPPTDSGTDVWVVDTATLQRVAEVHLPAPAFDTAPTPDGRAILATTDSPDRQSTRLVDVPSGHELAYWPWSICCLELWPMPSASASKPALMTGKAGGFS
jgi:hypothetical protein